MTPQRAHLNQDIWAPLEQQVLTWAMQNGPLYIVTGTILEPFPYQKFKVYQTNIVNKNEIYTPALNFEDIVMKHHKNFITYEKNHSLKPKRDANPSKMKKQVKEMKVPTGYYKIIYKPATHNQSAQAIAFLIPHTFETLKHLKTADNKPPFWSFVSRIDVIEASSQTYFPGIPESLKRVWGSRFFEATKVAFPSSACVERRPKGVLLNSTKQQRIKACQNSN
jgi:DNA/RNA endonuclease G (NUC1)